MTQRRPEFRLVSRLGFVWALILAWTVAVAPAAVGADSTLAAAGSSGAHAAYVYDSAPSSTTPAADASSIAVLARPAALAPAGAARLVSGCCLAAKAGSSALEDASRAAFDAADGPINISAKHLAGAGGRWNKFAPGVDVDATVREALRSDGAIFRPIRDGAGNLIPGYRVDTDLGRAIGAGGRTGVRAIVSEDGHLITAYPYGPKVP